MDQVQSDKRAGGSGCPADFVGRPACTAQQMPAQPNNVRQQLNATAEAEAGDAAGRSGRETREFCETCDAGTRKPSPTADSRHRRLRLRQSQPVTSRNSRERAERC